MGVGGDMRERGNGGFARGARLCAHVDSVNLTVVLSSAVSCALRTVPMYFTVGLRGIRK